MKQAVLDLPRQAEPSFDNFVCGNNRQLVGALQHLTRDSGCLYLWGPPSSGKSHLLGATAALASQQGREVLWLGAGDADCSPGEQGMLLVDDVEQLSADAQLALFGVWLRQQDQQLSVVISGRLPPKDLPLREDLRTRIGQAQIFGLQGLRDAEKATVLHHHASNLGFKIDDELVQYLLHHGNRELETLIGILDDLGHASLEQQRPVTLPLLRELMQGGLLL